MMAGTPHRPRRPGARRRRRGRGRVRRHVPELIEQRRADGSTDDLIGVLTAASTRAPHRPGEGARRQRARRPLGGHPVARRADHVLILLVVAGNDDPQRSPAGSSPSAASRPAPEVAGQPRPQIRRSRRSNAAVSPVMSFMRTVTHDHTYKGVRLKAGDRVHALPVGQPHEAVFDDPDERIDRNPNPHLGFDRHPLLPGRQPARPRSRSSSPSCRLRDIRAARPTASNGDSSLSFHQAPARRVHAGEPLQPGQVTSSVTGARRRRTGRRRAGAAGRGPDPRRRRPARQRARAPPPPDAPAGDRLRPERRHDLPLLPSKADSVAGHHRERRWRAHGVRDPMRATWRRTTASRSSWPGQEQALDERTILRLLVAEGLHGNETARHGPPWCGARRRHRGVAGRTRARPRHAAGRARLVWRAPLSAVLEQLVTGPDRRRPGATAPLSRPR